MNYKASSSSQFYLSVVYLSVGRGTIKLKRAILAWNSFNLEGLFVVKGQDQFITLPEQLDITRIHRKISEKLPKSHRKTFRPPFAFYLSVVISLFMVAPSPVSLFRPRLSVHSISFRLFTSRNVLSSSDLLVLVQRLLHALLQVASSSVVVLHHHHRHRRRRPPSFISL